MRAFKVIALSCYSKKGILNSGETVTEDAFEEGEADELVKEGFLEAVSSKAEKKSIVKQEDKKGTKKKGLGAKLLGAIMQ